MARFFISYARVDADRTSALVRALEFLGHDVWIDRELVGGHKWWDAILDNIRRTDVFLAALSAEFLDSVACRAEYGYARSLDKVTLPVLVGDVVSELLPADLASIQYVDYRSPDEQAALALAKAIAALPAPKPLPDSLPAAPPTPLGPAPVERIVADVARPPSPLVRPLAALFWGAIIVLFIFPVSLMSALIVLVTVLGIFGLDQSQTHLGWTFALTAVMGWLMWVYLSKWLRRCLEMVVLWWRRRSVVPAKPEAS